jgi:hypothetical protein
MEAAMASTGKNERRILMPEPESQAEIASDNGEGISVPNGLSNSLTRLLPEEQQAGKRHSQKLWSGSMTRQRKTLSQVKFEVPWRGWGRLRRCFAPDFE